MAKAVYRPGEIAKTNFRVVLEPPFPEEKPEVDELQEAEQAEKLFSGPTPAELEAEAARRAAEWEIEKAALLNSARAEAADIIAKAMHKAEECAAAAKSEAAAVGEEARSGAEKSAAEAEAAAKMRVGEAEAKSEEIRKTAEAEGREEGHEAGYTAGRAEVDRLIARTQLILERLQDKRADVFAEAEQQIISLVLLIARKVVKAISENQRDVVIENIKEALAKVKTRGKVAIKVNLADLELSSAHLDEFTKAMEGNGAIQILEDSSVDAGGCIIETDFGEIDARIAGQLSELETKILDLSPVKQRGGRT